MQDQIRWGILSTGAIARAFAHGLKSSRTGVLAAVASRSLDKAQDFAREFGAAKSFGDYQSLLDDDSIDAVYIATPHPQHVEWALKAARAGKHMLVEKPIALNHAEATLIADAAAVAKIVVMEAFMYRCHPATAKLVELIRNRAIGEVRVIQATFSFHASFNRDSRAFNNDLAGGGILDVGRYTASISRLIAGAAVGKDFDDPIEVKGVAHLGETGVDEWAVATLKFSSGIVAQLATGVAVNQENGVKIFGSEGRIIVSNPYLASRKDAERATIIVHRNGADANEHVIASDSNSFTYEADVIGNAIGQQSRGLQPRIASPAPGIEDTLSNMRVLDQWRQSAGLSYEQEKPENFRKTTAIGAPLARAGNAPMQYGRIEGIDLLVARLVMGVDNQRTFPHAAAVFDHYFELGGNAFDTAWIYANGWQESLLGDWLKLRGVRDQVVVISKGCHPPFDLPHLVRRQMEQSLDRLKIDCADIYMLHRDNTDVPVGEFVDALNEMHRAGRMKIFGGSNWSTARIDAANEYAARHNLRSFSVLSNQFSLARMVEAPWEGCLSASDDDSRAWLFKKQIPLLPWSSQARGFFLPGTSPEKRDDRELARCWYSDGNFERLRRARELANTLEVDPIQLALAYVLNQPFATFPLIGPRNVMETRSSLGALSMKLSDEQTKWLDLR